MLLINAARQQMSAICVDLAWGVWRTQMAMFVLCGEANLSQIFANISARPCYVCGVMRGVTL